MYANPFYANNFGERRIVAAAPIFKTVPFTFTSVGETATVEFDVSADGDMELLGLVQSWDPVTPRTAWTLNSNELFVNFKDEARAKHVFSEELSTLAIAGRGRRPYYFPGSYVFGANKPVKVEMTNGSTASNSGYLTMICARLNKGDYTDVSRPDKVVSTPGELYAYQKYFSLTASETQEQTIPIVNLIPFECMHMFSTFTYSDDALMRMQDQGSGWWFLNDQTPLQNCTGYMGEPFCLYPTRRFAKDATIVVEIENGTTVQAGRIVLVGLNRKDLAA